MRKGFRWAATGLAVLVEAGLPDFLRPLAPAALHSRPFFSFLPVSDKLVLAVLALGLLWRMRAVPAPARLLVGSGLAANALEYLAKGRIEDYIPTGLSYTNTADLCIAVGCVLAAGAVIRSWRAV